METAKVIGGLLVILLAIQFAGGDEPAAANETTGVLREARLPVPSEAEQLEATKEVEETFRLSQVRKPEEWLRTAGELEKAGQLPDISPAERFVLMKEASQAARKSGDAIKMASIIDELSRTFATDPLPIEAALLEQFAESADSAAEIESLVQTAASTIGFALREREYELAKRMSDATLKACNRPTGLKHRKAVADRHKIVVEQYRAWQARGSSGRSDGLAPAVSLAIPQVARRHCVLLLTMDQNHLSDRQGRRTLTDASGRENHGGLEGPPIVTGKVNEALKFDGADDFVTCADNEELNPQDRLTLCAWVRPEAWIRPMADHDYVISKDEWTAGANGFVLRFSNSGQLNFTLGLGRDWGIVQTESRVTLKEWTHVAAVYDGQRGVLLINAVEQASKPLAGSIAPSKVPLQLGRGAFATDRLFSGQIDEVAVFNIALTAEEIRTIYKLGQTGKSLAR